MLTRHLMEPNKYASWTLLLRLWAPDTMLEKSSQYTTTVRLHANVQQGKYYSKTFIIVLYAHIYFGTF